MKLFNSHLSIEQIADAIENPLAARERRMFQSHLENCPHCAREYNNLAHSINLMRADKAADAPPEALTFAKNLFRTRKQFLPRAESLTKKIWASLKLDVAPYSTVFGERSASGGAERQMLFEAGDFDVDLRIHSGENDFILAGQILGEVPEQISLELQNQNFSRKAAVSELGEFKIENIPAGSYDLNLRFGESEIVIPELKLA